MGKRVRRAKPNAAYVKARWGALCDCRLVYGEGKQEPEGANDDKWTSFIEWRGAWNDAVHTAFGQYFGKYSVGWYYERDYSGETDSTKREQVG